MSQDSMQDEMNAKTLKSHEEIYSKLVLLTIAHSRENHPDYNSELGVKP